MANIFQNLTETEVEQKYNELKAQGYSEDEIFDAIYAEDCNLDEE